MKYQTETWEWKNSFIWHKVSVLFASVIHPYFGGDRRYFFIIIIDSKELGAVHILRQPPEGGGGVSQKLTIADGGGIQEPLVLADVICEQPLMHYVLRIM